ncbi:hypothetical protein Tsubulata_005427 [Turnera subulata]|uniref:non-specific serine/threonine protein kinase n=1 Tax=Turnera subulata TaxID=218843 RepID=A0A9Q0JHL3_9ROSI|nr:hypothetical protein Tsubulata_005427 [Turnera subulata]
MHRPPDSRSGPWLGSVFSGAPFLQLDPIYNFSYVHNDKESYFTYYLPNSSVVTTVIQNDRVCQRYTWIDRTSEWSLYSQSPADICDTYDLCGAYATCTIGNSPVCSSNAANGNGKSSSGSRTKIVVGTLTAGVLLLVLVLVLLFIRKRRKQQKESRQRGQNIGSLEKGSIRKSREEDLELPLFDLDSIVIATDDFSSANKLGEGGFGPVYKGILEGGQEIAVKRLSKESRQGLDEFKNEVLNIVKLQHRNLVKLHGCCIEAEEKMLIYEFMPNKSLDFFIFDKKQSQLLDWTQRFNIINGIARGLLYLHQDSRLRIIHRDLKASNILLDFEMNPKISDFGLARSFGGNEIEANTNKVVGTYGYISPEYAIDGLYSVKSDVFSFGVLVLEIVSGRRNRGFTHPDHQLNLLGHAWRLFTEGKQSELISQDIIKACDVAEVERSIHVGLLCVQQSPRDRPGMSSVVMMLGSEALLPPPKQPGFFTERDVFDANSSSSQNKPYTENEYTITLLHAR